MKKYLNKSKKNIIFFCPSIEEGGVEKNLINICNNISQFQRVTLVTANTNKKKKFNKNIEFVSPKKNKFNNQARLIKSLISIILLIRNYKKKPTTVISFQSNIFAIIISKILGYKIIIRSNQSPIFYAKNIIKRKIMKFFFKKANQIIVNSDEFKKEFKKYFNLNSVVIYNLIEDPKTIYKLAKKNLKNNFFEKSKKIINILSIGRLVEQKNQITILKALDFIKDKQKYRLMIIGKGVKYKILKSFIKKKKLSKYAKILNYKKNVYPYYLKADVFILSSLYEGLPNTLIEAVSLGVPIISSNCKTGPKEILKNGNYGKLFKVKDYKKLSSLIAKTKKKQKIKLINDKRFNFKLNLKKYQCLINSL